ncbi:alpha/beta hydrolase [Streptomyces somaliensis DSM 40738]|uniref:Alpha/beta hydrolase n=1 Tax=Streptomyces somaliensis (strain ATCC 33201 / DSM 40738 / JCM 12659 / KCTC 9044 / NCTC 11332 / NRRL B-12077 / IP 733) TaxID=1134445 RepID=A0AA44DHP4_STRE0|nr:alpha/beta hydrolase [Streptomyces somaliensis]MCQ0025124.1 alpha/beta hydrolase [Streptomyces somaliensis DSM 40738]NKY16391.1 alpha/beta hydrolase [Streptomyces somaliensis DSM 40738]
MCPESRSRRRGLRVAAWSLTTVLTVAAGLTGVVLWQNSYDMDEQRVSIRHGGHTLNGVLATPRDGRKRHGLVVYVHGDGPVDATHGDGYKPMWEANAEAGYASLSWDKPGVAGAPGNWLHQSMDDRADEAAAAIAWARARPDVDGDRIGLWGASQAGWVLPKIAARTPVRFAIAVSPAINWLRQGRYNLLAELRADGASAARTRAAIARSDAVRRLLERRATFEEYVGAVRGETDGMTADRWEFVSENHTADATRDLRALRGTPVLLVLAGHDVNVDTAETERVYREELDAGGALTVGHYPDATHSLLRLPVERSRVRTVLTALFSPRSLFADGFLDDQRRFLRDHG